MVLPTFEKQAEIPKGFEDLYTESDGKWIPKPDENVARLDGALTKEREARKTEARARKEAEESRAELERQLAAAHAGPEAEKVRKALEKFDADLAAAKATHAEELGKRDAEIRKYKLTDRARDAFLKAGGRPERAEKMASDTSGRLDLDGDRIVVKDAKGEITTQTVEDFFAKTYRAEVPEFYRGTLGAGGGAQGGANMLPGTQADRAKMLEVPGGGRSLIELANAEGGK